MKDFHVSYDYFIEELKQKFGAVSPRINNGCDKPFLISYLNVKNPSNEMMTIEDSVVFYEVICKPRGMEKHVLFRSDNASYAQERCDRLNSSDELEDGTVARVSEVEVDFKIKEVIVFCEDFLNLKDLHYSFDYISCTGKRTTFKDGTGSLQKYLFRKFMEKHCPILFSYLYSND